MLLFILIKFLLFLFINLFKHSSLHVHEFNQLIIYLHFQAMYLILLFHHQVQSKNLNQGNVCLDKLLHQNLGLQNFVSLFRYNI